MKKLINITIILVLICILFSACSMRKIEEQNDNTTSPVESVELINDETKVNIGTDDNAISTEISVGGGTSGVCPIHGLSGYHTIPGSLATAVAHYEEINAWQEKYPIDNTTPNNCNIGFTITNFIKDFNISKEDFLKNVALHKGRWDVDLLYSGTEEEISEYYAEQWANGMPDSQRYNHYFELCDKLKEISSRSTFGDSFGSIPFMVKELNINRETLEKIVEDLKSEYKFTYEYDYDIIYNEDGTIKDFPQFEGYDENQSRIAWADVFCSLREPPKK